MEANHTSFYIGLAITSFVFWPMPLFYGRKPYVLTALAFVVPLQFPQAIIVMSYRSPSASSFRDTLLATRLLSGLLLGFANVNFFPVLLDVFGASLQAAFPHEEVVNVTD